jgi:hypothetical protein
MKKINIIKNYIWSTLPFTQECFLNSWKQNILFKISKSTHTHTHTLSLSHTHTHTHKHTQTTISNTRLFHAQTFPFNNVIFNRSILSFSTVQFIIGRNEIHRKIQPIQEYWLLHRINRASAEKNVKDIDDYKVRASRKIKKGKEILMDYNMLCKYYKIEIWFCSKNVESSKKRKTLQIVFYIFA